MKRFLLTMMATTSLIGAVQAETLDTITVAGGCYWCVESDFESVQGVKEAVSGFAGGTIANPTYEQVSDDNTGHYEAVEVTFDSEVVSRRELYDFFFRSVDPLDAGGQFCDRGDSYRTAIFANSDDITDAQAALASAQAELGQNIVTPILKAQTFYKTHDGHQDYYKKHSLKYGYYRKACGRDARVEALWGESVKH